MPYHTIGVDNKTYKLLVKISDQEHRTKYGTVQVALEVYQEYLDKLEKVVPE